MWKKGRRLAMVSGCDETVRISLVIISISSPSALKTSLDAILTNDLTYVEIIVIDGCSGETTSDIEDSYPSVKFFRTSQKACVPFLAGAGLSHATGEIIALTDTSCLVSSSWVANIIRAHSLPTQVIGGSVEPSGSMSVLDWTAYFCDYGQFMHPMQAGPAKVLPGNNISIKRSALTKSSELLNPAFRKTLWCEKLHSAGEQIHSQPEIETYFSDSVRMVPFLTRRYRNARCFAGIRSKEMTKLKRLFYVAGVPLLVCVLIKRTVVSILLKGRYKRQLILSIPFLGLASFIWSLGEACGYLTGHCQGCKRSLKFTSSSSDGAEPMGVDS